MEPERWHQVREVLADVIEAPPDDRAALLQTACTTDAVLRQDLEALLGSDARLGRLLSLPPAPFLASALRTAGDDAAPRPASPPLPAGSRIGPYEVLTLLGAGGMGEVYLADDNRLYRQVALKRVSPRVASDPLVRSRTLREARAAARLTHPGIALVHDVVEHDDGSLLIVMEYVSGESLAARLRRGRCDIREALDIAIAVAAALEHAHSAGIIHCDVKPANIQLTPAGAVKVLDFGIAQSLVHPPDAPTGTSEPPRRLAGTPGYMAPEQALGLPVDARADVFSLGVVLFEMLSGTRPFGSGRDWLEPVQAALVDDLDLSALGPHVKADTRAIIRTALQRDPRARYPSAAELRKALEQARLSLGAGGTWRVFLAAHRKPVAAFGLAVALAAAGLTWRTLRPPAAIEAAPQAKRWYDDGVAALQEGAYLQATRALERATQMDPAYPLSWARMGEAQLELDQEGAAAQSLLKAASLVPDRRRLTTGDRLALEAAMAMARRDPPTALRAYSELLRMQPSSAPLLLDLGRVHEAMSATAPAVDSYQRAARLDPENPAPFLRVGILYGRQGNAADAQRAFDRAEELYTARGRTEGIATVFYERAVMLHRLRNSAAAWAALERARQLADSVGSRYLSAAVAFKMSSVAGGEGKLADAEKLAQDATRLSEEYPALNAFGLVDVGNVYLIAEQLDKAEGTFREAVAKAQRAGAARAEARAHLALATVLDARGDAAGTVTEANAALLYYDRIGFAAQQTLARTLLVRAQERQGDLAGAEASYKGMLDAAVARGSQSDTAEAHYSLAVLLLRRERYAAALEHSDASLRLFRTMKSPRDVAHAILARAEILWRMGRFEDAEAELHSLFSAGSESGASTPSLVRQRALQQAWLALARGDTGRAGQILSAAAGPVDDESGALAAGFLSASAVVAARSGRFRDALQHADAAAAAARRSGDRVLVSAADLARAEALLRGGRYDEALEIASALADGFRAQQRHESAWIASAIAARAAEALRDSSHAARWQEAASAEQAQATKQFDEAGARAYSRRVDLRSIQRKGAAG